MMKEEFLEACKGAPDEITSLLKSRQSVQSIPLQRTPSSNSSQKRSPTEELSSQSKFARDDMDETSGNESSSRREKFENERPLVAASSRSSTMLRLVSSIPQESQTSKKMNEMSPHLSRLLPQQHLFKQPSKALVPPILNNSKSCDLKSVSSIASNRVQNEGNSNMSFSIEEIIGTKSDYAYRQMDTKKKITTKTLPMKPSAHLMNTETLASKGIRSTVPLKIKPPKLIKTEKDESNSSRKNPIFDDSYERYSSIKPTKKRISHAKSISSLDPESSDSSSPKNYTVSEVLPKQRDVLSDCSSTNYETVDMDIELPFEISQHHDTMHSVEISATDEDSRKSMNKKQKKDKKNAKKLKKSKKSKKEKHVSKNLKKIDSSDEANASIKISKHQNNEDQPRIKLLIRKTMSDGHRNYVVQNL